MPGFVLLVFAFVLFVVGVLLPPPYEPWRNRITIAGLACWVASELIRLRL